MRHFHTDYRNYLELSHINELAVKSPAELSCAARKDTAAALRRPPILVVSRIRGLPGRHAGGAVLVRQDDDGAPPDRRAEKTRHPRRDNQHGRLLSDGRPHRRLHRLRNAGAHGHRSPARAYRHARRRRGDPCSAFRLHNGHPVRKLSFPAPWGREVAIFEGIHALSGPLLFRRRSNGIYISARMRVTKDGAVFMPPEWLRFVRRSVRDELFRDSSFQRTLGLWKNVRRGRRGISSPRRKTRMSRSTRRLPTSPACSARLPSMSWPPSKGGAARPRALRDCAGTFRIRGYKALACAAGFTDAGVHRRSRSCSLKFNFPPYCYSTAIGI